MRLREHASPCRGGVNAFAAVARRIFHDQPWDAVCLYVQRAWLACDVSEDTRWEDAEPLIRQAWSRDAWKNLAARTTTSTALVENGGSRSKRRR